MSPVRFYAPIVNLGRQRKDEESSEEFLKGPWTVAAGDLVCVQLDEDGMRRLFENLVVYIPDSIAEWLIAMRRKR